MKKTFKYILAAFAVVMAVACVQEIENPEQTPQQDVELEPMTIIVGTETKVSVADDQKTLNWCDDDKIAVWDGVEFREFTVEETNGKTATFTGSVKAGSTKFSAVYPYSAAKSVDSEGLITAEVSQEQTLDGENLAHNGLVAVCSFNKGEELAFKTAVGFLRVDVSYEDVSEIYIDGAAVAGEAQFNADGTLKSTSTASNYVVLTPAGETFAAGSYYVALLPGTTPAGEFHITLVRAENNGAVMTANKDIVVPRNKGFFVDDTKLTESFIIKDAATLKAFLADAKNYVAGQHATIIKDIDLTGETITSAESFKGILNGRNHSIKNWTSEGVSLFTSVAGHVHNVKIDASCKVTAAAGKDYGLFVGKLEPKAVLQDCENNADISLTTGELPGSRIAAFVGKNDGLIKNCVNNGNINIECANRGGVTYIGAIAGHSNPRNQIASSDEITFDNVLGFDGCINNGDVTFTSTTGNYLYVAGISHSTISALSKSGAAVAESSIWARCNFKDCVNNGDITVTVTNGGSMEDNAGTAGSGNYVNIGGCVGFTHGELRNCDNYGKVTLNVPTNESSACMSRPAVGGVAGFVWKSLTDCDNHGKMYVKGTFAGGGTDNAGAGNCAHVALAGVVAQVGPFVNGTVNDEVKNCHNHGELEFHTWMANNGTSFYHGGVAGFARAVMTNCSNNATLTVVSKGAKNHTGGVAGQMILASTGLHNYGKVNATYLRTATTHAKQISDATYVGGVVGYASQNLTTATNNNAVTVSVPNSYKQSFFGGVIGCAPADKTYNGLVNNESGKVNVTIGTCSDGSFYYMAGIVGTNGGETYTNCKNFGDLIYDGAAKMRMGGIAPYTNKATTAVVECDITARCTGYDFSEVGGLIGYSSNATVTGATFKGNINTSGSTKKVYTGGILGKSNAKHNFNNCLFSGTLTTETGNNAPGLYCGGLESNNYSYTFGNTTKCVVGAGSKINGVEVTTLTKENLISQVNNTGGFASTATLTNIVIE